MAPSSFRWIASTTETLLEWGWVCGGGSSMEDIDDHGNNETSDDILAEKMRRVWSGLEYEPRTWDYDDDDDEEDKEDDDTLDSDASSDVRNKSLVDDDEDDVDDEDYNTAAGRGADFSFQQNNNSTGTGTGTGTTHETKRKSSGGIRACNEPQERGSNIPVLRQLPSFGSTLASNSMHSGSAGATSGMNHTGMDPSAFSYQRTSSSSSSTFSKRYFVLKPSSRVDGVGGGREDTSNSSNSSSPAEESTLQVKPAFMASNSSNSNSNSQSYIFLQQ